MSINDFITNKNIELIWEVINDYDLLITNQDIANDTILFIQKNIHNFYESEKVNTNNLKEMNKKFIIYIINYINNYFSSINNLSNTTTYKKSFHPKENAENNYSDSDNYTTNNKELVTLEEIQKDRKNLFEKQLLEKQKDFSDTIKLNIPSTPNFSDKVDEPLSEIDELITTLKQHRNLEEETFKNTSLNETILNENNNWLKSKETSIKKEKINNNIISVNERENNNIKYIKIEKDVENNINIESKDIIDLDTNNNSLTYNNNYITPQKKHISWNDDNNMINNINIDDNQINNIDNNSQTNNIFSKLKKIELDIPLEITNIKDEIKTICTKVEELNKTMSNILTFIKSKNISLV